MLTRSLAWFAGKQTKSIFVICSLLLLPSPLLFAICYSCLCSSIEIYYARLVKAASPTNTSYSPKHKVMRVSVLVWLCKLPMMISRYWFSFRFDSHSYSHSACDSDSHSVVSAQKAKSEFECESIEKRVSKETDSRENKNGLRAELEWKLKWFSGPLFRCVCVCFLFDCETFRGTYRMKRYKQAHSCVCK